MKSYISYGNSFSVTLSEARKALGTISNHMTDHDLKRLMEKMEVLTDIVVAHVADSKIQSPIEFQKHKADTDA